jgi:VCBS repeat-containing protein
VASCEPDEPEKITVSVSPTSLNFNADGGSQQISVTSNGAWTVRVDGGWMTVSTVSGAGNGSFEVKVEANDGEARQSSLTLSTADNSATVTVTQAALPISDIAKVRALYKGSDVKITDPTLVKGTVVSNFRSVSNGGLENYTSQKTIIVQDATGGLQFFCTNDNTQFAFGDVVVADLTGQTLSVYNNGPLQVNGLPLDNIERIGKETPSPREITVAQLLTGDYESTYVAVKDVQVQAQFLGKHFSSSSENTSIGMEGKDGGEFDIFTSRYAVFRDETVPSGSGTLKGIAGKYGTRFQLTVSAKSDYAGLMELVQQVNATEVSPEDILSDHPYYYCRETGQVTY